MNKIYHWSKCLLDDLKPSQWAFCITFTVSCYFCLQSSNVGNQFPKLTLATQRTRVHVRFGEWISADHPPHFGVMFAPEQPLYAMLSLYCVCSHGCSLIWVSYGYVWCRQTFLSMIKKKKISSVISFLYWWWLASFQALNLTHLLLPMQKMAQNTSSCFHALYLYFFFLRKQWKDSSTGWKLTQCLCGILAGLLCRLWSQAAAWHGPTSLLNTKESSWPFSLFFLFYPPVPSSPLLCGFCGSRRSTDDKLS